MDRDTMSRCSHPTPNGGVCGYQALSKSKYCGIHLPRLRLGNTLHPALVNPHRLTPADRSARLRGYMPSHKLVSDALTDMGVEVITDSNGWPDLLVRHGNKLFAIEVKRKDQLHGSQPRVLEALKAVMPVFVCRIVEEPATGEISFDELVRHLNVTEQMHLFETQ